MRRLTLSFCAVLVSLVGCTPNQPVSTDKTTLNGGKTATTAPVTEGGSGEKTALAAGDRVVAMVSGKPITASQMQRPLMDAYGLNVLLNLVQLELAQQKVASAGLVMMEEDYRKERDLTVNKIFRDSVRGQVDEAGVDYEALLDQFLNQQRISRTEFDLVMRTNACLRKLAEPQIKGRISDENVKQAFNIMYGESAQARHIALANLQEVAEVRAKLAAGETFEQVAIRMSHNRRTGALGGELPPFTRDTPNWPQAFKDTVFSLKAGEVSEPVQAGGFYHLVKLERLNPPKAVRFEDVKDSVKKELEDRFLQAAVKELRDQLADLAQGSMKIEDPVLRHQYEERVEKATKTADRDQVRKMIEKDRPRSPEQSATQPATLPAMELPMPRINGVTTAPDSGGERPPATAPVRP